jgi:hypothetical protein
MSKHLNRSVLAGGMEFLVGDTHPEKGVEFSGGLPDNTAIDWTAWLKPEEATRLGMTLIEGAGEVLRLRERARVLAAQEARA